MEILGILFLIALGIICWPLLFGAFIILLIATCPPIVVLIIIIMLVVFGSGSGRGNEEGEDG